MKVLDLFCGRGGWSKPFVDDGDKVIGIDKAEFPSYPGAFMLADIRTLNPLEFKDYDLIIGSPPCTDFSIASQANTTRRGRTPPNPEEGLKLIYSFLNFVDVARPRFWAMENVSRLQKFFHPKPSWHFKISQRGYRCLWSNFSIPFVPKDLHFKRNMAKDYKNFKWKEASARRAEIPYPIARFIADVVKGL